MNKIDILKAFSRTKFSKDNFSKDIFNRIISNAFENSQSDEEDKVIGAIALKYDLPCLDEILHIVEDNGFTLPFNLN